MCVVISMSFYVCLYKKMYTIPFCFCFYVYVCVCARAPLSLFFVYHLLCISLYLCFYYFLKDHDNALIIDEKEEDEETRRNEGIGIVYKGEGSYT